MFTLLRKRLGELDGPKWAAIFVFEFIVVLLGVLAAQMLQERFEAQRERNAFEANREALNRQLDSVGTTLILRGLQAECVTRNLRQIVDAVEAGRALPEGVFTTHPPRGFGELTVWDGALAAQTRKYLTPQEATSYEFLGLVAGDLRDASQAEERDWATLALAKENAGNLGDAGRTQVLLAANSLLHAYEGWERAPAMTAGLTAAIGAQPSAAQMMNIQPEGSLCREEVVKGLEALDLPAPEGNG